MTIILLLYLWHYSDKFSQFSLVCRSRILLNKQTNIATGQWSTEVRFNMTNYDEYKRTILLIDFQICSLIQKKDEAADCSPSASEDK